MSKSRKEYVDTFINQLGMLDCYLNPYEKFRDYIEVAFISLVNQFINSDEKENSFNSICKKYGKGDSKLGSERLSQLLGTTVLALENCPYDFLGDVYMQLDISNSGAGQFFTPFEISRLMAKLNIDLSIFEEKSFITLSEPACGSGGMVIAYANELLVNGINPQERLWVSCIDVDPMVAKICYIQLSLMGIAGEVLIGNTLTHDISERYFTPFHYLNDWDNKIKYEKLRGFIHDLVSEPKPKLDESGDVQELFDLEISRPPNFEEQISLF